MLNAVTDMSNSGNICYKWGNLKDYKNFLDNFFIKFLLIRELDVSVKRQRVKKNLKDENYKNSNMRAKSY